MAATTKNSLKVLCGTWNVGAFQPKEMIESDEKLDLSVGLRYHKLISFLKLLF